ncbi:Uma2 family endonuclease [Lewinella cohaerens]|uniref:Uma2 family endonuclease n=1 Tax=Lewinella cohaerens TaxID=70995 RepID=UPI000371C485|nr:Uma2 family endonuclease [Lewinella cohaerens]
MTTLAPQRMKFTVDSYYKMAEHGLLGKDRQVELINGDIIDMSPIRSAHAGMVNYLSKILIHCLFNKATVCVQNPVHLDDFSEPEPDVLIAQFSQDDYRERHPRVDEVILLIEVADSSLIFDRNVKKALYAEASIPEYWIINLADEQIEIFQQPQDGEYQQMKIVKKTDHFSTTIQGEEVVFEKLFG